MMKKEHQLISIRLIVEMVLKDQKYINSGLLNI